MNKINIDIPGLRYYEKEYFTKHHALFNGTIPELIKRNKENETHPTPRVLIELLALKGNQFFSQEAIEYFLDLNPNKKDSIYMLQNLLVWDKGALMNFLWRNSEEVRKYDPDLIERQRLGFLK